MIIITYGSALSAGTKIVFLLIISMRQMKIIGIVIRKGVTYGFIWIFQ